MPKYKTHFSLKWLEGQDQNGDEIAQLISPVKEDDTRAKCLACKKSFTVAVQV